MKAIINGNIIRENEITKNEMLIYDKEILNSDIYCEFIADGIHVHPAMFKLVEKLKKEVFL